MDDSPRRSRGRLHHRATAAIAVLANVAMMIACMTASFASGRGFFGLPAAIAAGVYGAAAPGGLALSLAKGVGVHVLVALALGWAFAVLVNGFTHELTRTGVAYGLVLWGLDEALANVLPPFRAALDATSPAIALLAHVVFGVTLAALARFTIVPFAGFRRSA